MARLVRDCPSIVGVKEASGSLDQMTQVILACGPDFSVLSGDDNITLPLMSVGGRGVISVIANVVPRETAEMTHAALAGDWKLARELHLKLFPLSRAMFIETNPIPVKETMALMGMIEPEFRLPMCRMSEANRAAARRGARAVRPRQALTRRCRWLTSWSPAPPAAWAVVSSRSCTRTRDLRLVAAPRGPRSSGGIAGRRRGRGSGAARRAHRRRSRERARPGSHPRRVLGARGHPAHLDLVARLGGGR